MIDTLTDRLAERLKILRRDQGWSLNQLATQSGVSRATLSRLENSEVSPTAEVLGKLCSAYSLTLSRLLLMVEEGFNAIVRQEDQEVWEDSKARFMRRIISPPAMRLKAELLECHLQAGANISYDQPPITGLEHHLYVLEGSLEVTLDEVPHQLNAGDCLRYQLFGSSMFRTSEQQSAKYLLVLAGG